MPSDSPTLDNFNNPAKKSGSSKLDYRAAIVPATPPPQGFASDLVETAVLQGAAGVRNAQRIALRYAKKALAEAVDHWSQVTPWLASMRDSSESHQRGSARDALRWRPRFLAALSLTHAPTLCARHARVSVPTIYRHRDVDKDFARLWDEAEANALDLLHARVWQRSLEGDLEPVWFMGVPVGYIRKFSDKLQIELLRAWKPDRFKTAGVNVNIGARGDVFVLSEAQRAELKAINREWLLTSPVPTRAALRDAQGAGGEGGA